MLTAAGLTIKPKAVILRNRFEWTRGPLPPWNAWFRVAFDVCPWAAAESMWARTGVKEWHRPAVERVLYALIINIGYLEHASPMQQNDASRIAHISIIGNDRGEWLLTVDQEERTTQHGVRRR